MKRRSFFESFMGVVATVALAPEIAFGLNREFVTKQFQFTEPGNWVIKMSWRHGDMMHATLVRPCHEAEELNFLKKNAWILNNCQPVEAFHNLPSQPYSELQRLRREGLCQ